MRVLIVVPNFLPFTGGVEMHVAQLSKALSAHHRVTVAALNFSNRRLPFRLAVLGPHLLAAKTFRERQDGAVKVVSLAPTWQDRLRLLPMLLRVAPVLQRWFYHQLNRLTHPFYLSFMAPKLKKLLADTDVVHTMATSDLGWATVALAEQAAVPIVCTPFAHPGQWGNSPDDIAHYNRCQAVIGLVRSDRDYLEKIGVRSELLRVVGVAPCLPAEIDARAFRLRESLTGEPVILYLGRMIAHKGAHALFQAAPLVWESFPSAHFYFAGPGSPDDVKMFEGCDPRIHYLGRVSDREKAEALAGCDVFCMPSTSEILPTVYLEAWSLKKPVVGGTAHGLRELVEGNKAGVIAEQMPDSIAEALLLFLQDPALREACGSAGKALVEERYSTSAVSRQLETLYEEAIWQQQQVPKRLVAVAA